MDFIHHIDQDPSFGTKITFVHFLIALSIQLKFFEGEHVAPWIMDVAQLGAWVVAIVVGSFTAASYIKKWFFKAKI